MTDNANHKLFAADLVSDVSELVSFMEELGELMIDARLPAATSAARTSTRTAAADAGALDVDQQAPPTRRLPQVAPTAAQPSAPSSVRARPTLSALPKLEPAQRVEGPRSFAGSSQPPTQINRSAPVPTGSGGANPLASADAAAQATSAVAVKLEAIRSEIGNCTRCGLCSGRTNIVHSHGNVRARLMFVGEAPGADEDKQALPFVGRAGQLLTKIIEAIGLRREDVFIGNINRCRPPDNRPPLPDETAACKPFLLREIEAIQPDVVVVLGNTAMKNLLDTKEGISKMRGTFQDYHGVKVMPTFHPAYLIYDPSKKRETWEDIKKVRAYLDTLQGES